MKSVSPLKERGFSLVELLLGISIVATALLLFIGVFFALFKSSQKGVDLTAGTVVAESELAKYLYSQQEDPLGLEGLPTDDTLPAKTGTTTLNKTIFTYEITSSDVTPPGGSSQDLRKVDIKVWWWQTAGAQKRNYRTGFGKLSVKISRLVYVRNPVQIIK